MDVLGGYYTRKPSRNLAQRFFLTFLQDKVRGKYIIKCSLSNKRAF